MAFAPSVAHKPVAAAVCPVMAATEALATEGGLEARGAIFTRSEVVDFILDLAGYTEDQLLHEKPGRDHTLLMKFEQPDRL